MLHSNTELTENIAMQVVSGDLAGDPAKVMQGLVDVHGQQIAVNAILYSSKSLHIIDRNWEEASEFGHIHLLQYEKKSITVTLLRHYNLWHLYWL